MNKPIDFDDTTILTEREYVSFGMCPDVVNFLKNANMFGKPNGEIKEFIASKGKPEWLEDWEETHLSHHVFDRVKKRLHPEYYKSTYLAVDNFAKTELEFDTLEEAVAQDVQNKVNLLNKLNDPYDSSVDVNEQIGYHHNLFKVQEKMTSFTGLVVYKAINA